MRKLYIITGASGHLGSTIIRRLYSEDCLIRGLIMPGEKEEFPGRVSYFRGDVTVPDSLESLFADTDGYETFVIHAAGIISIGGNDGSKLYDVNVTGTENIITKCIEHGVSRLLYVSSVHAIPERKGHVISEVSSFLSDEVEGAYAKTKAAATEAVIEAAKLGLLDAVVVHPSGIIGPYDSGRNHLVQLVKMYIRGKLPAGVGGGYDFVDVRDVADGCVKALRKGRTGECYILSNSYVTIRELLDKVREKTGEKRKICLPVWVARLFEPLFRLVSMLTHTRHLYTSYALSTIAGNAHFSHLKATRELGYKPRDFSTTLSDTVAWLKGEA